MAAAVAPYLTVLLSFALFLVHNNFTVVLGDAAAHQAALHAPQLLYFTAFSAFASFPLYLPLLPRLLEANLPPAPRTLLGLLLAAAACGVTVLANTRLHPYLLADNRHYAFYAFRRLLLRAPPYSLLAPVPAYVAAACLQARAAAATPAWWLLYLAATAAALVAAPLVEPRYFIQAWVLWRMHVRPRAVWVLWLEAAWFVVINAVTIFMFLHRSFEWPQEPGRRQRFMW